MAKMTADQSLFTELLSGKRKAANGAAVGKGSGKDGNEKDPSCVEVPDGMEVNKPSGRKGKYSSKSASPKVEDLIIAGFDKMQYPIMRC